MGNKQNISYLLQPPPAAMADINSDDDPDSAAMAEAMGFTGFGMQRSRKRKLTPPAQTGANNAPLGKRRPLTLPRPVVSGGGGENAEEIELDDDDEAADDSNDAGEAQGTGGEAEEDAQTQAGMDALTFNDAPPAPGRPHHQLPPKPQQQHHQHHAGKPARHPGGRAGGGGGGSGQVPWWEGEWDPRLVARMVENPWDRLERQHGLGARGTWPAARGARGVGGGDAAAAVAHSGGVGAGGGSGGAVSSHGGYEQAAQAAVS